ncbi:two component transcriptional regulator, LuxR family [Chitinophaga sp. CF118]|uniref:response regulator transcription factor n=1 Tax=Chitinophaga sp. CF118 TaxID=1884367 RepID=UPI0008E7C499|nr:response regulator transcription factor [Chitinophaga sp. CF118]SFD62536.1 two component transcriptional regulator, LuxR family [Chitinophaga sp. CF118]
MNKAEKIRIILADAQPVFREGIKSILTSKGNPYIIREAGNTRELSPVLISFKPDILILDYNPTFFEHAQLHSILSLIPSCKVIIISSQKKKRHILRSLELNVHCYLTKESPKTDIQKAIGAALHGEKFFCTFIVDILLEDRKRPPEPAAVIPPDLTNGLTGREIEIIRLVASGKANKEIADELHLSPHTIHTHRRNIMKKLQLHSAVELYSFAVKNGMI